MVDDVVPRADPASRSPSRSPVRSRQKGERPNGAIKKRAAGTRSSPIALEENPVGRAFSSSRPAR